MQTLIVMILFLYVSISVYVIIIKELHEIKNQYRQLVM